MLVDDINTIFREGGTLSSIPGFEFRRQQFIMAEAITDALTRREHLVVEAPTGVGKSIAYLLPAILFALNEERKAIVSTHTKNLQGQLLEKDLSLVRSLVRTPFTAVSMKGRGNYLCTTRLKHAFGHQKQLFDEEESVELRRILEWSKETADGDREDLPFVPSAGVWQRVCSEKGSCSPAVCDAGCFFQQARNRAKSADLVIMNHALFFTLFALQESDDYYLFKNDFVVFDEAHTLEEVAGRGTGRSLSRAQALFALHQLYNPATKKGLLSGRKRGPLRKLCVEAEQSVLSFFDAIGQAVAGLSARSGSLRVQTRFIVHDGASPALSSLRGKVEKLQQDETGSGKADFSSVVRLLSEAEMFIREFVELEDSSATYWADLGVGRQQNVTLHAAPTSIAESVGTRLFPDGQSVIMTSGTLSVSQSLDYFRNRLGAGKARTLILDSPFDFMAQMRVSIARDMPPPDSEEYRKALPGMIRHAVMDTRGRALVLFTNAALLRTVAEELREDFGSEGITLLVQDGSVHRGKLLEEFRNDVGSVLFGLESFWMGVDVPGEALGHVVITRLPFAVPDHPLIQARMELIENQGGNAFMEYTLPEAVLKFKQGVGRLIRSTTDTGVVTILDSRILKKRYGWSFLGSLPPCRVEVVTADGSVIEMERDEH